MKASGRLCLLIKWKESKEKKKVQQQYIVSDSFYTFQVLGDNGSDTNIWHK